MAAHDKGRSGGSQFGALHTAPVSVWQRRAASSMMERTMGTRGGRSPVRVGNLLTAAVPALAERMLEQAVRREWTETVGPEASRRTRPGALRQGTLEVSVDNSPWLQELTLRSASIAAALRKRHGSAVTGVRFALGSALGDSNDTPVPAVDGTRAPRRRLNAEEARLVDDTAALWVQLSQWLARSNEPVKAVEAANKAIALEPGNAMPHLTLADIFRRQRRFPDAEAELEKAIQLAPASPDAYIALAQQQIE